MTDRNMLPAFAVPFVLPNGSTVKNRLAKSAMSEALGTVDNHVTAALVRLYGRWADGGGGLLVTGNAMVDLRALGEPNNVVLDVYRSIRERTQPGFSVGIKRNSADFHKGGFTEDESLDVVRALSQAGIDLIEISGGTYEAPVMAGVTKDPVKESTRRREAYFLEPRRAAAR